MFLEPAELVVECTKLEPRQLDEQRRMHHSEREYREQYAGEAKFTRR
jgi:hypothetical protein